MSRRTLSSPLSRREREVADLVAAGLTDRAIGQRLFISERTVEGHLQQVRNKLGLDNRTQIASWITSLRLRDQRPAAEPAREPAAPPHNLPVRLTSFIGRERELGEIRRLLQGTRLLTIAGPGGCGKTRLAIEVAADVLHRYPGGLWFIDLSSVTDRNVVPRAIAGALGISEREGDDPLDTIASELSASQRRRPSLLILDNCEHLVDRCATTVDALLRANSDVSFLCTSREPLHVEGEALWKLGPLRLPEPGPPRPLARVMESDAVRLFVDRARLSDPEFVLDETNAAEVVDLCRQLDGIPLALELAAARVSLMSFGQVLRHLEERMRGVSVHGAPGRHETLDATIAWSHDLLGDDERVLLRRLAVFSGGFTPEAVDEVCRAGVRSDGPSTLARLTTLANKSLVLPVPPRRERYRLLQLIGRYASARLAESGELEATRRRHFEWYTALVERAAGELIGPAQSEWLRRLAAEHDNLRATLEFSRGEDVECRLRLVLGLNRFWHVRGHLGEGREWTDAALAASTGMAPTPLRAHALIAAGGLAAHQGDLARARAHLEEGLAVWRELGDCAGIQTGLSSLGVIATIGGEWEAARGYLAEGLALARELGDRRAAGLALCNLGVVMLQLGDHGRARHYLDEALTIMTGLGDMVRVAVVLTNLGAASVHGGRYEEAGEHYREGLRIMRGLGARQDLAECLEGLAFVDVQRGRAESALRLAGAAAGIRETMGAPHTPWTKRLLDRWLTEARAALGRAADAVWESGRDLPEAEAIDLALAAR